MNLKQRLEKDLLDAMRLKDNKKRNVIRLALTNVKLQEVEKHAELDDETVIAIIQKEIKTRKEVIMESQNASRLDLATVAQEEISILNQYLPRALTDEELTNLVKRIIIEQSANSIKDMGRVVKETIKTAAGRATNEEISNKVKSLLI